MQKCQQQHRQHEQSLHVAAAVASLRVRERERENEVERDFKGVAKESGGIGGWLCELVKLSHNDVYDKFYKSSSKLSCLLLPRLVFSCLARFLFLFFHFIYQFPQLQSRGGEGSDKVADSREDLRATWLWQPLKYFCNLFAKHTVTHTHTHTKTHATSVTHSRKPIHSPHTHTPTHRAPPRTCLCT